MPATYTYPGVYVEEIPSGVRTITGVSTSDTAVIDFFKRGPMNTPVRITSMAEFEDTFGGLDDRSEGSYAIRQFFLNGGSVAWVVRVAGGDPRAAERELQGGSPAELSLRARAASEGLWGQNLQVGIDEKTRDRTHLPNEFNLVVRQVVKTNGRALVTHSETHRNLAMAGARAAQRVLNEESELITVAQAGTKTPTKTADDVTDPAVVADPDPQKVGDTKAFRPLGDPSGGQVSDGQKPTKAALINALASLDKIAPNVFSLLCLPAASNLSRADHRDVVSEAESYCEKKRAFLIVDPPQDVDTIGDLNTWMGSQGDQIRHRNAAVYFPRVMMSDPLSEGRPREVGPSGTVAGVYARTDSTRGIWKAPAGTDARAIGVDVPLNLSDPQHGGLNPLGINVLRTFPIFGNVLWGARTLEGADVQASEWKYVPVRRMALYVEESLYQALKWVVFEENDEPLWSQIRLNVGAFMNDLFRQGAFQGDTPAKAYFVKCDAETTTQSDINRGVVNIVVGFAPLKPAEFVVIKLQQMAGEIES